MLLPGGGVGGGIGLAADIARTAPAFARVDKAACGGVSVWEASPTVTDGRERSRASNRGRVFRQLGIHYTAISHFFRKYGAICVVSSHVYLDFVRPY